MVLDEPELHRRMLSLSPSLRKKSTPPRTLLRSPPPPKTPLGEVGGVSQNVHVDLAAPQPELMVWTAVIHRKPRVAEAVQHVLKHGGKPGAVQPITTEPSVGSKGGVEVVIHLSKTREKRINISSIEQRLQPKTPK
jgi:hypothetical protein